VVISSLRWASQLSCSVSISSWSSSRCSSVNDLTHFALSNLGPAGSEPVDAPPVVVVLLLLPAAGLGAPKKDMMLAFCFGFLASDPAACDAALRLRVDIMCTRFSRGGEVMRKKELRTIQRGWCCRRGPRLAILKATKNQTKSITLFLERTKVKGKRKSALVKGDEKPQR